MRGAQWRGDREAKAPGNATQWDNIEQRRVMRGGGMWEGRCGEARGQRRQPTNEGAQRRETTTNKWRGATRGRYECLGDVNDNAFNVDNWFVMTRTTSYCQYWQVSSPLGSRVRCSFSNRQKHTSELKKYGVRWQNQKYHGREAISHHMCVFFYTVGLLKRGAAHNLLSQLNSTSTLLSLSCIVAQWPPHISSILVAKSFSYLWVLGSVSLQPTLCDDICIDWACPSICVFCVVVNPKVSGQLL